MSNRLLNIGPSCAQYRINVIFVPFKPHARSLLKVSTGYPSQSTPPVSGLYPSLDINNQFSSSSEVQRGISGIQSSSSLQYALRTQSPQQLRTSSYSQTHHLNYPSSLPPDSTVGAVDVWNSTTRGPFSEYNENYRSSAAASSSPYNGSNSEGSVAGSVSGCGSPSSTFAQPITAAARSTSDVYVNSESSTYSGLSGLAHDQQGPMGANYSLESRLSITARQQSNSVINGYLGGRGYNLGNSKNDQVKREPDEEREATFTITGPASESHRYNPYNLYRGDSNNGRFVRERRSSSSVTGEIVSSSTHDQSVPLRLLTEGDSPIDNDSATHSPNDSYDVSPVNSASFTRFDCPNSPDGEGITGVHILASEDPSVGGAGVAAGTVEPHALTAPLRAVNASKEMRALMGVFRLDPFQTLNGISLSELSLPMMFFYF